MKTLRKLPVVHFAWRPPGALFTFQTLKSVQCALNYRC